MAETIDRHILLVDDDATGRTLRKLVLESCGHRVLAVGGPEEALRTVSSESIDLVILDYFLDGTTGAELAKRMRELKPGLPILLLSGGVDPGGILEHVDACASKLDSVAAIEDKIAELLGRESKPEAGGKS